MNYLIVHRNGEKIKFYRFIRKKGVFSVVSGARPTCGGGECTRRIGALTETHGNF